MAADAQGAGDGREDEVLMARIRTVKPEFWSSEQVANCSRDARLLFLGMWNFCDDYGVHTASVKRLKMEVFPGDEFPEGLTTIRRMIDELIANGLLMEYEAEGESYWLVTGWKHQKIDKPTRKYPLPQVQSAKNLTQIRQPFDERSENDQRSVVLGMEGKGMEGSIGRKKNFRKPTPEEVLAYMNDRGKIPERERKSLSERFVDHYEMKGWLIGKSPMKDWQAAVRTWEQSRNANQPQQEGEGWKPYVKPEYN
jgi:hypothetical protein